MKYHRAKDPGELQFTIIPRGTKLQPAPELPSVLRWGRLTSSDLLSLVPSFKKINQPKTHLGNHADNQRGAPVVPGAPVPITGEGKFFKP